MRPYFQKMQDFGQELKPGQIKSTEVNVGKIKEVEAQVDDYTAGDHRQVDPCSQSGYVCEAHL